MKASKEEHESEQVYPTASHFIGVGNSHRSTAAPNAASHNHFFTDAYSQQQHTRPPHSHHHASHRISQRPRAYSDATPTTILRRSPRLQQIRQSFVSPDLQNVVAEWMGEDFRQKLSTCIPYIVGLVWRDGITDFDQLALIPIFALARSATSGGGGGDSPGPSTGASEVSGGKKNIWKRFFAYVLPKKNLFNTASLVVALAFVRRLYSIHQELQQRRAEATAVPAKRRGSPSPSCVDVELGDFLGPEEQARVGHVQFEFTVYFLGLLLAMKYTEDKPLENESWARIIGLTLEQVNRMERQCLCLMRHGLFIGPTELDSWINCLQCVMRQDHAVNHTPTHRHSV